MIPDPLHLAAMLDDELRRVQEGIATPASIERARRVYHDTMEWAARGGHPVDPDIPEGPWLVPM